MTEESIQYALRPNVLFNPTEKGEGIIYDLFNQRSYQITDPHIVEVIKGESVDKETWEKLEEMGLARKINPHGSST